MLGSDVYLFAAVHLVVGEFTAEAFPPEKVRRMRCIHGRFHGFGQVEERFEGAQVARHLGFIDAVIDDVEEAYFVADMTQAPA